MINFRTDTFFNASSFDLTVILGNAIQPSLACLNPKNMHTKAKFSPKKCKFQSLLLIKRAKIDQFEKTQGDLESSFHGLFDDKLKFEKFSLVKNLFKKNCRKRG